MPNLNLKQKWLRELNDRPDVPFKFPSGKSDTVFCVYCEKTFSGSKKSDLTQHRDGAKHAENKKLKQKRCALQATLENVVHAPEKKSR